MMLFPAGGGPAGDGPAGWCGCDEAAFTDTSAREQNAIEQVE